MLFIHYEVYFKFTRSEKVSVKVSISVSKGILSHHQMDVFLINVLSPSEIT